MAVIQLPVRVDPHQRIMVEFPRISRSGCDVAAVLLNLPWSRTRVIFARSYGLARSAQTAVETSVCPQSPRSDAGRPDTAAVPSSLAKTPGNHSAGTGSPPATASETDTPGTLPRFQSGHQTRSDSSDSLPLPNTTYCGLVSQAHTHHRQLQRRAD